MEEAAGADKVVIINKGQIVGEGTSSQLKDESSIDTVKITPKDMTEYIPYI